MKNADKLQTSQIVCIEYQTYFLYAEVIDIIEDRQMCWGRPIMLAERSADFDPEPSTLFDLREGSDVLLPVHFFRPALDTEVITLMMQLATLKNELASTRQTAHQQLRHFIQQIWQAYPDSFKKFKV